MPKKSLDILFSKLDNYPGMPKNAYDGDAGFDLLSSQKATIEPLERQMIKCGFCMAIPKGFAGLVIPRSGLALKHGITVLNSPGLIDSGYRGEICVVLYNTDKFEPFQINIGDRIAQLMIVSYEQINFSQVDKLCQSLRQDKSFGSSGINS